jgi:hypothetical protein
MPEEIARPSIFLDNSTPPGLREMVHFTSGSFAAGTVPGTVCVLSFSTTLETLKRLSGVLTSALDALDRNERVSDATIADYRTQLTAVDADRQRLEESLRALWTQVERQ